MTNINKCSLCKLKGAGRDYEFFYGNITDTKIDKSANKLFDMEKTTTTYRYSIAGSSSAFICNSCVAKNRLLSLLTGAGGSIGVMGITFFLFWMGQHAHKAFNIGTLIFGLISFVFLFSVLPESISDIIYAGNNLAKKAKKKEYKASGFRELLTPKQYRCLKAVK